MKFNSHMFSLADIVGQEYVSWLIKANVALGLLEEEEAKAKAYEKVDFYSQEITDKQDALLDFVGRQFLPEAVKDDNKGAPTNAFGKAQHSNMAPITGLGSYRLGEDGKLYFIGKSEHYHASFGHRFGGYKLIDNARALGVLNATHNNTRGYITRLAEQKLVELVNEDYPTDLDRVINLETGSLAVEAGVKMMLARFYRLDHTFPEPKYHGRIPVFFVMGDHKGGIEANYHGTTVITQTFRGLWPEIYQKAEETELYKVVPVSINDLSDFQNKIQHYNIGKYKTAGFLHEIILMNYGAIMLDKEYISRAHALCKEYDTPVLVDEIQTGMWYKEGMLFKKYGLKPDFVVVGKGFPGGEYPGSKIITNAAMDSLNQFGALVTNGQEELASLSYLVTIKALEVERDTVDALSNLFESELRKAVEGLGDNVIINGLGYLVGIQFDSLERAASFAGKLNESCIDASAQLYKANCPPVVLLKPPVNTTYKQVLFITGKIKSLLTE